MICTTRRSSSSTPPSATPCTSACRISWKSPAPIASSLTRRRRPSIGTPSFPACVRTGIPFSGISARPERIHEGTSGTGTARRRYAPRRPSVGRLTTAEVMASSMNACYGPVPCPRCRARNFGGVRARRTSPSVIPAQACQGQGTCPRCREGNIEGARAFASSVYVIPLMRGNPPETTSGRVSIQAGIHPSRGGKGASIQVGRGDAMT